MKTYEPIENSYGETVIKRTDENGEIAWIPCDEANSDYQRYLRWLENPDAEEGGTL
jgi:hypothetical protein